MKLSKLKTLLIGSASMLAVLSLTLVSCSEQTEPNPIPDPTPPKPVPVPPNISEFQKGGEIIYNSTKKLSVNKYLSVVQKLDFREYTNIGDLTDSILNEKLTKDPSFSNLTLSILDDSSQTTGKLLLSLNGKYENLEIKNEEIIISNFPNYDFFNSNAFVHNIIAWNNMNFIQDLKDETTIQNISIEEFFKYNNDIVISYTSIATDSKITITLNDLYKNNFISNMTFSNINLIKNDWNISFNIEEKKYKNGRWIISNTNTIKLNGYKVEFNVQQAALEVLSKTATIEENMEPMVYASTIFANWRWNKADLGKYIKLNEIITNHYFESIINIKIEAEELNVDDDFGILEGKFKISFVESNKFAKFDGMIDNFKKSDSLFTPTNIDLENNILSIEKGSLFEKNLIKDFTKQKLTIESLSIGESVLLTSDKFNSSWDNLFKPQDTIFDNFLNELLPGGSFESSLSQLKHLSDSGISLNILGSKNESLYNILSSHRLGAFKNMFIKIIHISKNQNNEKVIITKIDKNNYKITYKINIELDYLNSSQKITLTNETVVKNPIFS